MTPQATLSPTRANPPNSQESAQDTRERILDAAEKLFAQSGFAGTSLRAITSEAKANLAAVNYHFGSKENLFVEVLSRGFRELNRERIRLLDELEKQAGTRPVMLEKILRAFFLPAFEFFQSPTRANFLRVICRAHYEAGHLLKILMERDFKEIIQRFLTATRRAVPNVADQELFWRMHFTVGAMIHSLHEQQTLCTISGETCKPEDYTAIVERLVAYAAAGIKAR